jgi:hypothetical protein
MLSRDAQASVCRRPRDRQASACAPREIPHSPSLDKPEHVGGAMARSPPTGFQRVRVRKHHLNSSLPGEAGPSLPLRGTCRSNWGAGSRPPADMPRAVDFTHPCDSASMNGNASASPF